MDKISYNEIINIIHEYFTTRKEVIGDGWDINRINTDDYVLYQDCVYLEKRLKEVFEHYKNNTLDWENEYSKEETEFYGDDEND